METIGTWWMWAGFTVLVIVALIVDLLVMRQQGAHKVSFPEALRWSMIWIALALAFNGLLYDGKHFAERLMQGFTTL